MTNAAWVKATKGLPTTAAKIRALDAIGVLDPAFADEISTIRTELDRLATAGRAGRLGVQVSPGTGVTDALIEHDRNQLRDQMGGLE